MFLINFRCLAHIVNLGNVDVMAQITKLTAVENATAIWEYDPTKADNRVLGGSLDVIAAICMLAIKVKIELDRKSTRLNSSHPLKSRMPSSA